MGDDGRTERGARGRRRWRVMLPAVLAVVLPPGGLAAQEAARARLRELAAESPRLTLTERVHRASDTVILEGTYRVWEDREARRGRMIDLHIVVLPSLVDEGAPDPVFLLHGGPGAAATAYLDGVANSWLRARRDVVLVDQRGTGRSNPLRVPLPDGEADPQVYLDPLFVPAVFAAALPGLRGIADLARYTTPIAMDDLDEVREALGYGRINLRGGSYGTRAALVYLRRHPKTVRTATLNGIAPISFVNPLYHAAAAQEGLETLAAECASDPRWRERIPDLGGMVEDILARLAAAPARVTVTNPATGDAVEVSLSRDAFAEALRVLMYHTPTNRQVPGLVERAHGGDYAPFAQQGLESNRALRRILCFGMLMCVTNAEDLPRIDPAAIPGLTAHTFLGDARVRAQMAVGEIWPRGTVPEGYGEPVCADVPVLLWSGTHDPVTPARWGAEAARHLPRALHLVVPGTHGVTGPCVARIEQEFLASGTTEGLDLSCVETMHMPPLQTAERDV